LYALGEIVLVVIGILIALQINNWNEDRKLRIEFRQSMLALASEIRNDTLMLQRVITSLEKQERASLLLLPILESEDHLVTDSIAFTDAFMNMSTIALLDVNTENWDELKKSGRLKDYADPVLMASLQEYYNSYLTRAKNYGGERESRLEMRALKYELLTQNDFDRIRFTQPPRPPSQKAFNAIFNDDRVRTLTKSIRHTSWYFRRQFMGTKYEAQKIIKLIEQEYGV
jgi:hypothetical protein